MLAFLKKSIIVLKFFKLIFFSPALRPVERGRRFERRQRSGPVHVQFLPGRVRASRYGVPPPRERVRRLDEKNGFQVS